MLSRAPAARAARAGVLLLLVVRAFDPTVASAQDATNTTPAAPAADAPAAETPPAPRARVLVRVAAPASEREAIAQVLQELMQRLSVELRVVPVEPTALEPVTDPAPGEESYLARCFIDLNTPGRAALVVHDPQRDRIVERRVESDAGPEVVREELGHMLLGVVEALLSGATLGAPRDEVMPPKLTVPPPRPTADAESSADDEDWTVSAGVAYEAALIGHGPGLSHGPLLIAGVTAPLRPRIGLLATAQYRFPFSIEGDLVGVRLQTFALRALATIDLPLSLRAALRFGLGAGADAVHIAPQSLDESSFAATRRRTSTFAVARALVAADVRVARALSLWAALAADLDLDPTQYVLIERGNDVAEVTAPLRVRPALLLGAVIP